MWVLLGSASRGDRYAGVLSWSEREQELATKRTSETEFTTEE